jgi:hypothetical protein
VRVKPKDGKEGKEAKETKEVLFEKTRVDTKVSEIKINQHEAKASEVPAVDFAATGRAAASAAGFEPGDEAAPGRAFIRPSERPEVAPRASP